MTLADRLDKLGIQVKKIAGSIWYVVGVNAIILLCWTFNLLFLGVAALIVSFLIVLLTQKNLNALMPVIASAVFIVSETGGSAASAAVRPEFFDTLTIILYCCLPFLLGSLVYFFWRNKIKIRSGPVSSGLVVFFAVALFGGAGSELYNLSLVLKTLMFCLVIFGAYLLFYSAFDFREEGFKRMFALAFTGAAAVVAAEVLIAFIRQGDGVFVGWGNGGTAGQILVMYLPFAFYLILTAKHKWEMVVYYLLIAVALGALFISRSRSGMLAFGLLAVPMFIVMHKKLPKEHEKLNLILLAGIFAAALAVFAVKSNWIIDQLKSFFGGSGDITSGRTDIWADGWKSFKESPILGKGFSFVGGSSGIKFEEGFIFIYWYHNTVIQILVNTGLIGFAAFGYYMYKKYSSFLRKGDILNFFIFAGLIIAEIHGLFDPHVVSFAHSLYVLLFVAGAEQLVSDGGERWLKKQQTIKETI